jgi:23S rRNA (cytosine1962-C5)-methyltransferase
VPSILYPTASLKPHREESLLKGHLWIFSGALQQPPRWIEAGGLVDVKSATGQFVARGYYNPRTDIAIRVLTYASDELIDSNFFYQRVERALALRQVFDPALTNTYRLINAEGDDLPGLVVDRYADILAAQIHTAGMEKLRPLLIDALMQTTGAHGLLFRNESQSRRREGLEIEPPAIGAGVVPTRIPVRENGIQFLVDPWQGQKTGLFLDQRDKREALRKYARHKRVLNCFSYTGGFSVYAALASRDTHVTSVDISAPALDAAREHFIANNLDPAQHEFILADVFDYLEEQRSKQELFDVVVLDPPAFAKTESARGNALKAYLRLNTLGMQMLRPGGILVTCSCSGAVKMDDLLGIISLSAQRLQQPVQVLESYTHGVDHPLNLAMPETAYLKVVFCRLL